MKRYFVHICSACKIEYGDRTPVPDNYGLEELGELVKTHGLCDSCAKKIVDKLESKIIVDKNK